MYLFLPISQAHATAQRSARCMRRGRRRERDATHASSAYLGKHLSPKGSKTTDAGGVVRDGAPRKTAHKGGSVCWWRSERGEEGNKVALGEERRSGKR